MHLLIIKGDEEKLKIIKNENELINSLDEDQKEDAIIRLKKSNTKWVLLVPIILSLFIVASTFALGLKASMPFNKWFFVAIFLNSLLFNINRTIAIKDIISHYNQDLKYKKPILEKIDSIIIILLVLSFVVLL